MPKPFLQLCALYQEHGDNFIFPKFLFLVPGLFHLVFMFEEMERKGKAHLGLSFTSRAANSSTPWASASQAGPASSPRQQAQRASQPAAFTPPGFSHPRARTPPLAPLHVAIPAPLVSAYLVPRTHLFPLLSPSPWGLRAQERVSSHR